MSDKICIFAGTTEGRKLTALLKDAAEVIACVATEYGGVMLDGIHGIKVHSGRMNEEEMAVFFNRKKFDRIIDATHPYAQAVTDNIAAAAGKAGIPYMRILREKENRIPGAVYVSSVKEAEE
jgi:precorrin-6x reductase